MDEGAPDWADERTQAEIAAQLESELADEFDDEDPYGMLDFEGHFDSEDEEEVRREMAGYKLGGWMDSVVDVFLRLEEFPDSQPDLEAGLFHSSTPSVREEVVSMDTAMSVEPPPEHPKGIWDDVTWFGRLVVRTIAS
jgi:hypothetical protein